MNSFQKTVYGLILVLFISIIVSSALYAPEYKVVDIAELELRLNTDKQEYFIGDSINCSVYLVNNYPYKVRTLPQDKVIFYQQPKDFKGSIHPQIKYVDSTQISNEE